MPKPKAVGKRSQLPVRALLAPDLPLLVHKPKPKTSRTQKYSIITSGWIDSQNIYHLSARMYKSSLSNFSSAYGAL